MIDAVGAQSVGRVRTLNEDGIHVGARLLVVADGMGGHAAGDRARDLILEALAPLDRAGVTAVDVQAGILSANQRILDHADRHPEAAGMGTTVCGALLLDGDTAPVWLIFNVGDSRVYCWQPPSLQQVTHDHSEVQELVDAGLLTPQEARVAPNRNVITRAVGQSPPPEVDFFSLPAGLGEMLLLTSDGLTSEVDDDAIRAAFEDTKDTTALAAALVSLAEEAGGRDNISVVLGRVPNATEARATDGGAEADARTQRSRTTTVPRELVTREVIQ